MSEYYGSLEWAKDNIVGLRRDIEGQADLTQDQIESLKDRVAKLETTPEGQHVYHHRDNDGPRINTSVEKNSKGYNYTATVTGAASPEEAIRLIAETLAQLRDLLDEA